MKKVFTVLMLISCVFSVQIFAANETLRFTINRAAVPNVYFKDITLKVKALGATSASVTTGTGTAITSRLANDEVIFTTTANEVVVYLAGTTTTTGLGQFTKAVLRDDKKWAWSHGMDDNVNYVNEVPGWEAKGWFGTFFIIAGTVSMTRNEPGWIYDAPTLITKVGQGWSLGNHGWDHHASESQTTIENASRFLTDSIVKKSARPDYLVTSFANPAFVAENDGFFKQVINAHSTTLIQDETGGTPYFMVDPNARDSAYTYVAFNVNNTFGRYFDLSWDAAAGNTKMDWIAGLSNANRHMWINSGSHGNTSDVDVINHVYSTYGPGGNNTVWVAPSDQIIAYLLTRNNAVVSYQGTSAARRAIGTAALSLTQKNSALISGNRALIRVLKAGSAGMYNLKGTRLSIR
jgi:peptidoglycan/xylan/chitin deacetylase (PgdA/CDA1 family)